MTPVRQTVSILRNDLNTSDTSVARDIIQNALKNGRLESALLRLADDGLLGREMMPTATILRADLETPERTAIDDARSKGPVCALDASNERDINGGITEIPTPLKTTQHTGAMGIHSVSKKEHPERSLESTSYARLHNLPPPIVSASKLTSLCLPPMSIPFPARQNPRDHESPQRLSLAARASAKGFVPPAAPLPPGAPLAAVSRVTTGTRTARLSDAQIKNHPSTTKTAFINDGVHLNAKGGHKPFRLAAKLGPPPTKGGML